MEFWTIFLSTISGFIIGFLAEPVKIYISSRKKRVELRKALYKEMASSYKGLGFILQGATEGKFARSQIRLNLIIAITLDCYDYAKSSEAIMDFYQLAEAGEIDVIYKNFRLVLSDWLKTAEQRLDFAEKALHVFEEKRDEGKIDSALLARSSL